MSDNNKPPEGYGRGGRGAILLAALKNQPRRPGQPPSSEPQASSASETTPEQPQLPTPPMGRGAFLQSLLAQGRGRAVVSVPTPAVPQATAQIEPTSVIDPVRPIGRGRGLLLSSILSESSSKQSSPSPSEASYAVSPVSSVPEKVSPVSPIPRKVSPVDTGKVSPPTSELEELTIGQYKGTSGTPLRMEVNYVRLKALPGKGIYEYHVSFEPTVDSKNMKFKLMKDPKVVEIIGPTKTFDGSKLYLPLRLDMSPMVVDVNMPTDNSLVNVSIKLIKKSSFCDCLHLYNLIFKQVMRILKMTQVGRNYFNPKGGIPIPQHRLEIWPGYVTAVQEYEGGVMLNCDCSFKVLRTVTARDVMNDAAKQRRGDVKEEIVKALVDCVVLTRYNNKTYRIDDVSWDMNPLSTFVSHNGAEISFMDYYKRSYDIDIEDSKQPLLISKAKKREMKEGEEPRLICLIPELCFMTGLTDEMRNDFKVMRDVASYTRVTPENRQLALMKFINDVATTPEARQCFERWNLELVSTPETLDGRLLKSETLTFGRGFQCQAGPEADWGRQATSSSVLVAVNFEKWVCVFPKRDAGKIREFLTMMQNVCPKMGINVKPPHLVEIMNDRTETYCQALKDMINPNVQMMVIIFPTKRDDRYSAVKKLCCIEAPVPSQVINLKTISDARKLRSVSQKIALQMNCKLGGELWSVAIPLNDLMVCGLDTYHDNSKGRRSVLAFVSTINQNRTRWFSMTTMQKQGQEVGDNLKIMFINALKKYYEVNHHLPEKIILYRDGVGDGQMDFISKYEVEQLTSCYKNFNLDYNPDLVVVVVQKRINTRMYAVEGYRGQKTLKNPPPGSILDHSVTRKKWYDFFLVSQHVRQGTVTPTHYVVIHDTSSLKPEYVQRITYKMTHLYYNWPGTVRVPAPCQYAHKLAYLVGQSLHKETHSDLSDRLFYL
ncbi:piwi-like protein Ago3 [Parasteatoda tepidariorum]|uniref:piwi-like protein Ago3 n=1 Tax=Parasteatoda tepidariorum TaxID=114398 RepID=UPI001C71AE1C|nr:piwi-like protein Ago3 [Parasteatoda tepidariorum]